MALCPYESGGSAVFRKMVMNTKQLEEIREELDTWPTEDATMDIANILYAEVVKLKKELDEEQEWGYS